MFVFSALSNWAEQKWSWGLLFASAFVLELIALYFQYAMDLKPCIMCIYQRTAVIGVILAALLPLLMNNVFTRLIAFVGWGISAIWGLLIALEHVDLQNNSNPFFASCEIVPHFPTFMPLHTWLPKMFAATGDCGDIDWVFLDMSMPQWMIVIFAIYTGVFAAILFSRLVAKKGI